MILAALTAIAGWALAAALVGHRHVRFLERELDRERAARLDVQGRLLKLAADHQNARDEWAAGAAAERGSLLERLDVAYANLAHAPHAQPAAWPADTWEPEAGEDQAERARRVAAAEAIEAELAARVGG